jgi:hypothetical protein
MSACRRGSSLNEIENASRVRQEYAATDWPRRFIRGLAEDAKFEENREVIINPAVDAGFGATRRRRDGRAGGCGNRGNSGNHQPAPRERGFGETWKLKPAAKPEGAGGEETRSHTGRRSWTSDADGQPEASAPAAPKDVKFEVTRGSVAGKAGRCRNRGNSGTHRQAQSEERSFGGNSRFQRRVCRRMRDSRRLDDPSPARPEDAEAGATWRLIDRHKWKCRALGQPGA